MDKNPNRFNKGRNKLNQNQGNNMNFQHGKRSNKMNQMMNYKINQVSNFVPNEEYMSGQPYPFPNMYQMPMSISHSKEQNIKNMFKLFQKKNNYQNNPNNMPNDFMNMGDNEMSLEDNPQTGNKKFNNKIWNKTRIQRKRKNNYQSNKDLINVSPFNNMGEQPQRPVSLDNHNYNYDENFPEAYYDYDLNYNNFSQKGGKKKATTYEYSRNKKKKFYKQQKQKYDDNNINNILNNNNTNNSDNESNNEYKNYYNQKIYYNKNRINNYSDIEEDSNLNSKDNNEYYSNEEENEEDEEDKNSQDILVIDDNTSTKKEVLDINKIKLVEKTENTDNNMINIKSDIENKVKKNRIIPELTEMCSEKEIIEREKIKDIDKFEIDPNSFPFKKAIKERMVQKFSRKRGQKFSLDDPKEIRNISAINKTINYLINKILDCDKTDSIKITEGFTIIAQDIIDYIIDRFIAIYKTIEILKDNDDNLFNDFTFIESIGKMIRTIIIFINLCLDEFDDESPQKLKLFIDDLLLPLLEYFKDIIINESKYEYNLSLKDKDEFISYYLFIKLKKDRKNFEKIYQQIKSKLNNSQKYEKVELTNEIYNILNTKNYEKFIQILKDNIKSDYFTSCLMSLFFKEICVDGLIHLSLKYEELTYKQIQEFLTFEDVDEIRKFLIWYGITKDKTRYIINESDKIPIVINHKNKNFDYDKAPQKTNIRYIEKKKGDKLRKDMVSKKIEFIKNKNYNILEIKESKEITSKINEKEKLKNISLIKSDISNDKSNENNDISNNFTLNNSNTKKDIKNLKNNPIDESFISKDSYKNLFDNIPNNISSPNNKSETKLTSQTKDEFLKPKSPKKLFPELEKPNTTQNNIEINKSIDFFSHSSISSIEPPHKNYPNFNEQTLDFFCEVSSSIINKIISDRKLDFIYRLKFIVEKYKIKLELIENYINRRKFFVFHELKKRCLNAKYSKEYYKELINYNSNLNSVNTNENFAFKISNKNLTINKKFELLTYEDIIYFLIKDYKNIGVNDLEEEKGDKEIKLINHLQINIYTTKDLIKSTKIISSLKLKKNILRENSDGSELTIIDNINIDSRNRLSLIIKFIFVDQIIDLDSYIYDNQKNISKYSILIPFFDIIKSDPENQQILTKFFTILDLGLSSFIKKDIVFIFLKRDIEQTSDLYKEYQNIQNDFIFNLMQKYSTNNKNDIIYIDNDYENNEKVKEKIIYLSPIDEFGKCYQEYIKYLNNKTFVELFENNKLFHLRVFNPKEVLLPFEKHIIELDCLINFYINNIENDLQKYLSENNCINYFYNNKLCIEVLIGFVMCKILLIYYQYISLSFANELFKIPFYISNTDLLILEDNLLNSGSIFRQINIDGYDYLWKKCFNIDSPKKKNLFSYFDIFSEIICSYNLISDNDIQNYEYCFRKQYYDINLEKKNYEIAKNFVNFFNKIFIKFVSNNNLRIKNYNTSSIIEKIYKKNKLSLLYNISKIITNNSICFNEGLIYFKGIGDVYHGLERIELLEYNKNLNKKRKRNASRMEIESSSEFNETKKKDYLKLNKKTNINKNSIVFNENFQIVNNLMEINESIDKTKSSIPNETGDMNDDYYKSFRKIKKYTFPDLP